MNGGTGPTGPTGSTGPVSGTPIIGGTSGTSNLNNNRYMGMFAGNQSATERLVQNIIPTAGTVRNFFIFIETAPGAGSTWRFTLRKNGANTAVTCSVTGAAQTCSDLANSVVFAPGDLISVREEVTAGAPANSAGQWTAVFAP